MSVRIDKNLLIELGLSSLSREEKQRILEKFYHVLELRVGYRMYRMMSGRKVSDFENLIPRDIEGGNSDAAAEWIVQNFPEHRLIVQQEYGHMIERISARVQAAADESAKRVQAHDLTLRSDGDR